MIVQSFAEFLAQHEPITNDRGYIGTCLCRVTGVNPDLPRFDRDADDNVLKDDMPVQRWAEHVAEEFRKRVDEAFPFHDGPTTPHSSGSACLRCGAERVSR